MEITLGKNTINAAKIAKMCRGNLIGSPDNTVRYVCTDSREAKSESLFCAIIGERVDGHNYIVSAYKNGCRVFLCQTIPEGCETLETASFIVVDSTVVSLGTLAHEYRKNDELKVIAVTGSVGKTTTKEFIATVLPKENSYHTRGNYNSVIGLPLSMLEMDEKTEYAVLEMGMSARGEIESMSLAASPQIGIITNIGSSHLEMLGSREGIRDAKLEITCGMDDDGVLIINGDDDMLESAKISCRVLKVGIKNTDCDIVAKNIRQSNGNTVFDVSFLGNETKNITIPTLGYHNVYAAMFAFAVSRLYSLPINETLDRLSRFESAKMRQNIYDFRGITIIEDCYNASPESMRAAIDVLTSIKNERPCSRAVALLGDMLELGESSPKLHFEVGKYAASKGVESLVTFGPLSANTANGASLKECVSVTDRTAHDQAADALVNILRDGDVLLVKASRGLAAEKIIEILKERLK